MTKAERFADCARRQKIASKECDHREKILKDYLHSSTVKQLEKDFHDAIDALNKIIDEWNDIVMEDYNKKQSTSSYKE